MKRIPELDPEEVYQLEDILEGMGRDWSDRVVASNVEYLLKREGLLPHGCFVIIPAGTSLVTPARTEDSTDHYDAGFEVFSGPDAIAFTGDVRAWGQRLSRREVELLSIEVYGLSRTP